MVTVTIRPASIGSKEFNLDFHPLATKKLWRDLCTTWEHTFGLTLRLMSVHSSYGMVNGVNHRWEGADLESGTGKRYIAFYDAGEVQS